LAVSRIVLGQKEKTKKTKIKNKTNSKNKTKIKNKTKSKKKQIVKAKQKLQIQQVGIGVLAVNDFRCFFF
jgi:hypothetical protein